MYEEIKHEKINKESEETVEEKETKTILVLPGANKLGLYDEMMEKIDSIYELLSEDDIKAIIRLIDNLEKATKYDTLKKIINNEEE